MIDAPGRAVPRFPANAEPVVQAAITRALDEHDVRAGVTALAGGADILFAEALLARHGELHLVLPLETEAFVAESVRRAGEPEWERRFRQILPQAASLEVHGDDYLLGSGSPFQLAALLIDGQAQLTARARGWRALSLMVWDSKPGDGLGGTASFAGHAVSRGRATMVIDPRTGATSVAGAGALAAAQKHTWAKMQAGSVDFEHRLCAVLFADAKGFSGLRETQLPAFIQTVLGLVRAGIARLPRPPIALNTWGDGLFVVTATPEECGLLALDLIDAASGLDWQGAGLPGPVGFRVGLHAGPAYITACDPVTGRPNAYGRDISRASRIEPVAGINEAWCSRAFCVLAAAMEGTAETPMGRLRFEDLGERDLAKNSGRGWLYRVHRGS
ncbi:MAG: hypothetical protein ACT4PL_03420 [Phycisphaerales bacterium]